MTSTDNASPPNRKQIHHKDQMFEIIPCQRKKCENPVARKKYTKHKQLSEEEIAQRDQVRKAKQKEAQKLWRQNNKEYVALQSKLRYYKSLGRLVPVDETNTIQNSSA